MLKTTAGVCLLLGLGAFGGGCATGPKYDYQEQKDSASIAVPETQAAFLRGSSPLGDSYVFINKIDGAEVGFPSQWFDSRKEVFCAPGGHKLALSFSHVRDLGGISGGEDVGAASGSVDVLLEKDHAYRFTALFGVNSFSVTLWDVTDGSTAGRTVAEWSIAGRSDYVAMGKP